MNEYLRRNPTNLSINNNNKKKTRKKQLYKH